jgi:hypothetical protein
MLNIELIELGGIGWHAPVPIPVLCQPDQMHQQIMLCLIPPPSSPLQGTDPLKDNLPLLTSEPEDDSHEV